MSEEEVARERKRLGSLKMEFSKYISPSSLEGNQEVIAQYDIGEEVGAFFIECRNRFKIKFY